MRNELRRYGFTLLQLMIVTLAALVGLMLIIPALKDQIEKGRIWHCDYNLAAIYRGLSLYHFANDGNWPYKPSITQSGALLDQNAWIYLVAENRYVADLETFRCPSDPNAPDLEQSSSAHLTWQLAMAPSYGLNELTWHEFNQVPTFKPFPKRRPERPEQVILLADLGPDYAHTELPDDEISRQQLLQKSRLYGRLPADDGFQLGAVRPTESWLTGRHRGGIHLVAMGGGLIYSHNTAKMMSSPPEKYYDDCAMGGCTYCNVFKATHYDFSKSGMYWWNGSYERAP